MRKKNFGLPLWLTPFLVLFAIASLVAVFFRARSIRRNEGSDGIQQDGASLLRYVWLELKALLKFSRY